jgi:hypothetical protein
MARMWRKNQNSKAAPRASSTTISRRLSPAWRIPTTSDSIPRADRTAPIASKGRVESGGKGSTSLRLRSTIATTTAVWNRNAARQLITVVISPPINRPVAAPMPPIPLIRPNARARDCRSLNSSVVRM